MKIFSTFSGIGGFEIGIHNAWLRSQDKGQTVQGSQARDPQGRTEQLHQYGDEGLSFVGYSEIDKYAIKVYEKQFPGVKNYGDITKINAKELPDFDCLVGGFPCQAFSIAGRRMGFDDTRGTLFFDLARILRAKQPRLFVFENVKGLLSHDGGATFRIIIQTIDELGYDCQWQVLNSKNFGVPQNRERVYIVGHLRGTPRPEVFPITGDGGADTRLSGHISNTLTTRYEGAQAVGTYIGESKLDAQEVKIRRLTPIECERLQGFPDNWTAEGTDGPISDTQRYKMCGNAVTTNVVQAVFEKLLQIK